MSSVLATGLLYGLLRTLGLSLLRNRGLAAKDILLDLARRCFWQLGYEANFLRTREARQMITSVMAQLGFRHGRPAFKTTNVLVSIRDD
jgi:hypothetical protein